MNRESTLADLGNVVLRTILMTVKVKITDKAGALKPDTKVPPAIACFWHNRILAISAMFLREYPKDARGGVTVLTSPSKDGEILAQLMAHLGMGAVRGSSSKRGARAMREMIKLLEDGRDIAITPDGPRGPRYVLGPGAIALASETGAPIIPFHATYSRCIRMKTWDGFIVPLPFSEIHVIVDEPWHIPTGLNPAEFEQYRANLEAHLKNNAAD